MNRLTAHAEQQVRIGGRIRLNEKEFCKIIPDRNPDFYRIVKNLKEIMDKAQKTEDLGERRKLLPSRLEANFLKKLVKRFIILRGELTAQDRKSADRAGRLERQELDAYYRSQRSIR